MAGYVHLARLRHLRIRPGIMRNGTGPISVATTTDIN